MESGWKCNEHTSITNMAKGEIQKILLLWKCWNSAWGFTFNVMQCVIRLLSVKLLAAELQRPVSTLHYTLTSAASTDRERRKVNLQEIPYFRFCIYTKLFLYADNWATQNSKLYIETVCIYIVQCSKICLQPDIMQQSLSVLNSVH